MAKSDRNQSRPYKEKAPDVVSVPRLWLHTEIPPFIRCKLLLRSVSYLTDGLLDQVQRRRILNR